MVLLFDSPYTRAEYNAPHRFVRYTRTSLGLPSIDTLEAAYGGMIRSTKHLDTSRLRLLIDVRDAPPRNDPMFEEAMARYRIEMVRGFERVAILVLSAVGKLQVRRLAQKDGSLMLITQEEGEALQYLGIPR